MTRRAGFQGEQAPPVPRSARWARSAQAAPGSAAPRRHPPDRGWAGLRGWAVAALLAVLLAAAARPAAAAQDEVVPAGVWTLQTELAIRTDSRGIDHARHDVPLLDYLADSPALQGTLQGAVERTWHRVELKATYGLSDTWNLSLLAPYVSVNQSSSVSTTSSDPVAQAMAQSLTSRSLGGPGAAELLSLHRPVFSDRHGLVLGYGVRWPLREPASPWGGRGTLLLDSPFMAGLGLLHYTFYPVWERTHLDLRGAFVVPATRGLALEGGGSASVNPGNELRVSMDWGQEFGRLATGFGLHLLNQGSSKIRHEQQGDNLTETAFEVMLGWGNLVELELHPIPLPYQIRLTYDQTLLGAGVPLRKELRLGLQFYF